MATKLSDVMAQLPPARRAKIEARAQELILENMTLQDSVSRLEKRADLLLSTLRSYLKAMGGELKLVAEFPDRPAVIISALGELDDQATEVEVK